MRIALGDGTTTASLQVALVMPTDADTWHGTGASACTAALQQAHRQTLTMLGYTTWHQSPIGKLFKMSAWYMSR